VFVVLKSFIIHLRRKLRHVTDQSIQTAALIFESPLHLSENDTNKRIANSVFYIQSLFHHACNSMEFGKTVQYKKEEVIEAGTNCIKKNFMIRIA